MSAVASPTILVITVQPNTPTAEIIHVTAYTAGASTATVVRAAEGPGTARIHTKKPWIHGPTALDFVETNSQTLTVTGTTYTPTCAFTYTVAHINTPTANFTVGAPKNGGTDGQVLILHILSGATIYTPTWNAAYLSSGIATLPTTLVASKTVTCGFQYDAKKGKWVLLALDTKGY